MTPAGRERCADVTDQRVEFADRRGSASALRGLAEASGHSLDYVCESAVKNELGVVVSYGSVQHPLMWEVAMPSGYPSSKTVRHEFFDQVCRGVSVAIAAMRLACRAALARSVAQRWSDEAANRRPGSTRVA